MDSKRDLALGSGKGWQCCSHPCWWSGLIIGDAACISHVPCSCYQDTWTPCSLRKLWKRRSWSG